MSNLVEREIVREKMLKYGFTAPDMTVHEFIEDELPSVTQKSGKWILTIEDWNKWTCSECGYHERTDIHVSLGWKYCPNCGAYMVEPQESEVV